jgi:hypothetical protein
MEKGRVNHDEPLCYRTGSRTYGSLKDQSVQHLAHIEAFKLTESCSIQNVFVEKDDRRAKTDPVPTICGHSQ